MSREEEQQLTLASAFESIAHFVIAPHQWASQYPASGIEPYRPFSHMKVAARPKISAGRWVYQQPRFTNGNSAMAGWKYRN